MARNPDHADDSARAYLAPVDLREHNLPVQAALGFHRGHTEELLHRAADTIERLNRDLAEVLEARESWKRERDQLEVRLDEERTRAELLVGEAMLDAHKAGQAIRAEAEAEAEGVRAEAAALLDPAKQEAERLVAVARTEANQRVADAEAECARLAAQAEQYRLLVSDLQRRCADVLRQALEVLGDRARETFDNEAPFREPAAFEQPSESEDHGARGQDEHSPEREAVDWRDSEPLYDDRREDPIDAGHIDPQAPEATPLATRGAKQQQPSIGGDPMTRLWQNAGDRETGAEAIEAIRARLNSED